MNNDLLGDIELDEGDKFYNLGWKQSNFNDQVLIGGSIS